MTVSKIMVIVVAVSIQLFVAEAAYCSAAQDGEKTATHRFSAIFHLGSGLDFAAHDVYRRDSLGVSVAYTALENLEIGLAYFYGTEYRDDHYVTPFALLCIHPWNWLKLGLFAGGGPVIRSKVNKTYKLAVMTGVLAETLIWDILVAGLDVKYFVGVDADDWFVPGLRVGVSIPF